jgi:hypothetical protein
MYVGSPRFARYYSQRTFARYAGVIAFRERMEFIELNQILNTDTDIVLSVKNSDWSKVIRSITASTGWLNKSEFNSLLTPYINQQVFAFETFERVSKKTGIKKRITSSFSLTWDNFDTFQKNTDILFLYLVSSKLDWVFYANRDQWGFSARP